MFCPNCGEPHELKANFCSACGAKLARDSAPPQQQPVKVLDAVDRLLITGGNADEVQRALERHVELGARVLTALCQVGRSWTAACTIPPRVDEEWVAVLDLDAGSTCRW